LSNFGTRWTSSDKSQLAIFLNSFPPAGLERVLSLGKFPLIEITKATIHHGYRLIIEDFEVLEEEFDNEIVIDETKELQLLDKDYYANVFKNKGMMDQVGKKVPEHPGFLLTPVRMTRSKTRMTEHLPPKPKRLKTGGLQCERCDKQYKTEKNFNKHKCK
jgi:hypothetical protein